jgi:hypothetical protein
MAITLPTPVRNDGGDPGRRNARTPTAADVPTVAIQRDPGVAFGRDSLTNAQAVGKGIANIGDKLFDVAERQKKLEDATQTTDAQTAFDQAGMDEFRRRQTEGDPSDPNFMSDFRSFLDGKRDEILGPLQGKVSPEAYERIRARIGTQSQAMSDAAGRVQLDAVEKKALGQIDDRINTWSAQASRDPAFLDTFLGMADEGLADYSGALRPDQEKAARDKARSSIIVNAFSGLVGQKKFADAEKILGDDRFNEDIKPETRRSMMTVLDNGRKVAQSELRADVKLQLEDEVASIRETGAGIGLSRDRIVAAYGDKAPRILKALDDEKTFYQQRTSIALNSPDEDAALLRSLQPSGDGFKVEAERRDLAIKAITQKYAALEKDPVAYVMSSSDDVRDAYAKAQNDPAALRRAVAMSESAQEHLGVPEHLRRALSDDQAKSMVATITKVAPETAADAIQSLATQYGDQLWPQVYRDLVKAKLPPEYSVLATTDNPVARKSLAEALKVEANDKGALRRGLAKPDAQSVDDSVADGMEAFRSSLAYAPNGAEIADRYQKSASLLAYRYAATMGPADAARRAVSDLIGDKYDFVQDDSHNARVPRGQGAIVEGAADQILGSLKADDLPDPGGGPDLSPERRKEIALSAARRGTWVTNETDDGWLLLDVNQQPVLKKDGSRVTFKFADAPSYRSTSDSGYISDPNTGQLIQVR